MRITVAMRVIGGFAIITALLFIISISSFFGLRSIGNSTEEVNSVAIPSLLGVGSVQTQLLQISNVQLETYHEQNEEAISRNRNLYQTNNSTLEADLRTLTQVLNQAGQRTNIAEVRERAERFAADAGEVIDAQQRYLSMISRSEERIRDVEFSSDDAAMLLLDLTDDESISRELFNQAGLLETSLNSLVTLSYDLIAAEEINRAEIIQSEIEVAVNTVTERFNTVSGLANGHPLISEIQTHLNSATSALIGSSDALVETVLSSLNLRANSQRMITENAARMDRLLADMVELQQQVQRLADTTKQDATNTMNRSSVLNIVLTLVSIALAV